jgi:hypothetical protein
MRVQAAGAGRIPWWFISLPGTSQAREHQNVSTRCGHRRGISRLTSLPGQDSRIVTVPATVDGILAVQEEIDDEFVPVGSEYATQFGTIQYKLIDELTIQSWCCLSTNRLSVSLLGSNRIRNDT